MVVDGKDGCPAQLIVNDQAVAHNVFGAQPQADLFIGSTELKITADIL